MTNGGAPVCSGAAGAVADDVASLGDCVGVIGTAEVLTEDPPRTRTLGPRGGLRTTEMRFTGAVGCDVAAVTVARRLRGFFWVGPRLALARLRAATVRRMTASAAVFRDDTNALRRTARRLADDAEAFSAWRRAAEGRAGCSDRGDATERASGLRLDRRVGEAAGEGRAAPCRDASLRAIRHASSTPLQPLQSHEQYYNALAGEP